MSHASDSKAGRNSLRVRRLPVTFTSDKRRVIMRFFDPGGEDRLRRLVQRVQTLDDNQVEHLLTEVSRKFRNRHKNIADMLEQNYCTCLLYTSDAADE